jgi:hypothetical protein
MEEAIMAVHAVDSSAYVTAYNYGAFGNARVFRCISHVDCARRLRVMEVQDDEEEIPVTFHLESAGQHGTQPTNRKRVGIDLALKAEVDGLLTAGMEPKKCRLTLKKRYESEPAMLAKLPNESQVKNRLMTLKKNGEATSVRRARGRPRKQQDAAMLESDEDSDSDTSFIVEDDRSDQQEVQLDAADAQRFDKKKLVDEFTALPGRPVFWSILKKTRYMKANEDEVTTEWMTGHVIGWQTAENVPTKWLVKFSDGEKRLLELEELVTEIRAAVLMGLNVTGRPIEL